jgi:SOS-response transcriptional repressor LexA
MPQPGPATLRACRQDADLIFDALRQGLDYSRLPTSAIVLLEQIEDNCDRVEWDCAHGACNELQRLTAGLDDRNLPKIDKAYTQAVAQLSEGALLLCQIRPRQAKQFFCDAQRLFDEADAQHSEAVALMAQGFAYHRQYENSAQPPPSWSPALKPLRSSFQIFEVLEDDLRWLVRDRLAAIHDLLDQSLQSAPLPGLLAVPHQPEEPDQGKLIPIISRISAGEAILVEDNIEEYRLVDARLAERVTFGLRVKGHSMIKAGILNDDIILIEQRVDKPPRGQIVAALVIQMDVEATLKRFYDEGNHIRLGPANDDYPITVVLADGLAEEEIRARYEVSHPGRRLAVYKGAEPQIAGWARALIREDLWPEK